MTLHDIAKRANVSTATVSRAVNRRPTVSPVLARRVWRVIKEVGYYPNIHARALVSGRSRVFGLMISQTLSPFFCEIAQTFENLGFEHNHEIFLSSIVHVPDQIEVATRRMIEHRVEGVAILSFQNEASVIELFRPQNIPVVTLDVESEIPIVKTVYIDYEHGIRQAVQHLAALGHVRIAFVSGPSHLKTTRSRRKAFQECMKEIDLEVPPQLLVEGNHTLEAGMKALSALAAVPDRASAVFCSNDMMAIGVMQQAAELGLNIPRDLSVVGFDDIQLAQFTAPPLTTVQISHTEAAKSAFRVLLDSVEGQFNESSRRTCAIQTNLVLRQSTALVTGRFGGNAFREATK